MSLSNKNMRKLLVFLLIFNYISAQYLKMEESMEKPFREYIMVCKQGQLLPNRKTAPCWSAGRLMEIYGICMGVEGFFYCKGNFIDEAIRRIEGSVKNNLLDFSKLEDLI